MSFLPHQQSQILELLRTEGGLSRWQLHERLHLRPNTVGEHVADLLQGRFVHEKAAETAGPGRPRVPVAIDTAHLNVVGAAIRPGHVEACRLNLLGHALGRTQIKKIEHPEQTIPILAELLVDVINAQTSVVGISTTGFVDLSEQRILFSSALPGQKPVPLSPLLEVADGRPLVVDNDMHALAARWQQEHHQQPDEDVLLIYLDDGQLGSALLVKGEPNRGCLVGGNELGHTRLPVETEPCYCGHAGCLERICSTQFVCQDDETLLAAVQAFDGTDEAVSRMISLLAMGIANQVNFIRPHRVVLVSPFSRYGVFRDAITQQIRSRVMIELVGRVRIDLADQPSGGAGEAAGWLGLAAIYSPHFTNANLLQSV